MSENTNMEGKQIAQQLSSATNKVWDNGKTFADLQALNLFSVQGFLNGPHTTHFDKSKAITSKLNKLIRFDMIVIKSCSAISEQNSRRRPFVSFYYPAKKGKKLLECLKNKPRSFMIQLINLKGHKQQTYNVKEDCVWYYTEEPDIKYFAIEEAWTEENEKNNGEWEVKDSKYCWSNHAYESKYNCKLHYSDKEIDELAEEYGESFKELLLSGELVRFTVVGVKYDNYMFSKLATIAKSLL